MTALTVEQYAEFVADPEAVWSVIGDPQRLSEWTSARVEQSLSGSGTAPPSEWTEGASYVIADDDRTTWRVVSRGQRVVEVIGDTSCGRLGIGVRVIGLRGSGEPTRLGSPRAAATRVVFVARLEPDSSALRARLIELPRIRRRFDRWATALRAVCER